MKESSSRQRTSHHHLCARSCLGCHQRTHLLLLQGLGQALSCSTQEALAQDLLSLAEPHVGQLVEGKQYICEVCKEGAALDAYCDEVGNNIRCDIATGKTGHLAGAEPGLDRRSIHQMNKCTKPCHMSSVVRCQTVDISDVIPPRLAHAPCRTARAHTCAAAAGCSRPGQPTTFCTCSRPAQCRASGSGTGFGQWTASRPCTMWWWQGRLTGASRQ